MVPESEALKAPRAQRRVRVLHVINNLNYGGMERLLADIVLRADPSRIESHVLCLQYLGRFAEGLAGAATLHLADPLPRYSMLWPGPLARQIRSIAPDVVHTHSGVWYKTSLAARVAGVPMLVHTEHGRAMPDPWKDRLVDGIASRRTDVTIAVSESLRDLLIERRIAPAERIEVIRNGVDTELHAPHPDTGVVRRELGIDPATPIIGSIGRLEPIKGYDVAVRAFAALLRGWQGPPPALVLAGEGSQRGALEATISELGIGEAVHVLGWRNDVVDLLSCYDIFTMSSRSEGTSVSLLEAMSSGLCPVVTDVGGNSAVLGPDLAHRLVPSDDPEALARGWREALADRSARSRDSAAARERIRRRFSLDSMVEAYQALYLRAGGNSPATRAPGEISPLALTANVTNDL